MNRRWHKTALSMMAAGFALVCMTASIAGAEGKSGTNASYSSWTDFSTWNRVPIAKPVWSADIGQPNADVYAYPAITTTGNTVLYVKQGVLTARSANTGKMLWTYGKKLRPDTILTAGAYAYLYDNEGAIYRVSLKTGRGERFFQLTDSVSKGRKGITGLSLSTEDNALYAASAGTLVSIRLTDGKLNWRNDGLETPTPPQRVGDVLLFDTDESGAITVGTTYAIDPSTGKTKWRLAGSHSKLLHADGGELYFQDQWPNPDGGGSVKLDVASITTGEIVRTLTFPALMDDRTHQYTLFDKIAIDGDDLYIGTNGKGVYRYNLHADPLYAKPALISDYGSWIAGPYNGKLIFSNTGRLGIHAIKWFDSAQVEYEGVNNPISQLDMIDSGLYVGQTDGSVYALNVTTGKALFRYDTGARNYGAFQTTGSTLLVQAEGKLYGFQLPSELVKPISADSAAADSFAKTKAKLSIDGVERAVEPGMMTSANRMFVPFQSLTEAVGAEVTFDAATNQATVTYNNRVFSITQGKSFAITADGQQQLSFPPVTLNGNLYVPLKDFGQLLGIQVEWNASSHTVEIKTK
ncbi:stalk domain-containing protein [Paenibacillus kobensis]|uniref:stalk domain-containing protein n=1 Tax=Paenibacillus kobensis TaxID=59841 RepID=UPI000FD86585|nr:stalk domain-containing protein [Paenibacillus kobensis]